MYVHLITHINIDTKTNMVDDYFPNNKRPSGSYDNVQVGVSSFSSDKRLKVNSPENVVSASPTTSATTTESLSVCSSRVANKISIITSPIIHPTENVGIYRMQWMKCLNSTKKKKKSSLTGAAVGVTPPAAEIEEFFSVAEKSNRNRFAKEYNYDIVKDVPLEGRYQWMKLKP